MRARLALAVSGTVVEVREILLRDKHPAFLEVSDSKTVPCLVSPDGVIDESLDIMIWALKKNDPEAWLDMPQAGWDLIAVADGPFKQALDRTKYPTRYPDNDWEKSRGVAAAHLAAWNAQIEGFFFQNPTIADYAILPFVRQFAFIDKNWFDEQPWPNLQGWLRDFVESDRFMLIMNKLLPWQEDDIPVLLKSESFARTPVS